MKNVFTPLFFLLFIIQTTGNNLTIDSTQIVMQNNTDDYAMVEFDLSWENSFRDSINWDAAWVFVKYRLKDDTLSGWSHASLNYVDGSADGHVVPASVTINTPSDGMGVFIYHAADSSGDVSFQNIQLRWNYGNDSVADTDTVDVRVIGIEMIYVPTGNFWAGDGATSNINGHFEDGTSGNPLEITSEDSLILGGGTPGSLGNNNTSGQYVNPGLNINPNDTDDFDDVTSQVLPAHFPKGYQGFYCMKYELTQGQYAEFLNMLDATQAANRYEETHYWTSQSNGYRYNIIGSHPNKTTTTPDLPAIYVEYHDGAAYSDWAGLRPMTELEFEKASRGPLPAVAGEYVWGTATIDETWTPLNNEDTPQEGIAGGYATTVGNAWYNDTRSTQSVVRVGIYAANALNTGRVTAGATYWGIMEMSGNAWDRCVSVGHPEGRGFMGTHGDGELSATGGANNTDWPAYNYQGSNNEVDYSVGCGYRGGGWAWPSPVQRNLRLSSRRLATAFFDNIRYYDDSYRAVRTAPF